MTSGLSLYSSSGLVARVPRPVQRVLQQEDLRAMAAAHKARNIAAVTAVAMSQVADLTQLQKCLESIVPEAALRLSAIADTGVGGLALTVSRYAIEH